MRARARNFFMLYRYIQQAQSVKDLTYIFEILFWKVTGKRPMNHPAGGGVAIKADVLFFQNKRRSQVTPTRQEVAGSRSLLTLMAPERSENGRGVWGGGGRGRARRPWAGEPPRNKAGVCSWTPVFLHDQLKKLGCNLTGRWQRFSRC